MQRKRRGDVTRHTTPRHECVCVCRRRDRRTHDEVGGARSARRLARGSALARRALPAPALTEPSRRCNARGAVMSLDARRRIRRRARASTVRPARARRGRRRLAGATTRSRLGARSASPVSVLREPSRRCDEESNSSQQTASSSSQQQAASSSSQQQAAAASSSKQQQAAASSSSEQQQAVAASSSEQQQQAAASSGSKQQQQAAASSSKQQQQAAVSSTMTSVDERRGGQKGSRRSRRRDRFAGALTTAIVLFAEEDSD